MKEYLAYMAVVAEKIDLKKMTETEATYELVRKENEPQDRAAAIQARAMAAQQAQQDEATRNANEEAVARRASEEGAARRASEDAAIRTQASIEQQRLAMEREIAEKQLQQQRANGFLQAGMFLLTRPPPSSPQTVIIQQRPAQPVYYPPTILFPK